MKWGATARGLGPPKGLAREPSPEQRGRQGRGCWRERAFAPRPRPSCLPCCPARIARSVWIREPEKRRTGRSESLGKEVEGVRVLSGILELKMTTGILESRRWLYVAVRGSNFLKLHFLPM